MGIRTSLFPEDMDHERMLDMDRRLQPVRRWSMLVLAAALIACGPWLGFWTLIPLALAASFFSLADSRTGTSEHPEYAIFGAWAASQVIIAIAVALAGGPTIPTMSWFAIPIVTLSARFSHRGVAAGVVLTLILMFAVAFGVDAAAVIDYPPNLIAPVAMVLAIAILGTALMRSDIEHRGEAVVDQLTEMLNRKALEYRIQELEQQSTLSGEPVGMIVCDLDHFKRVNDSAGHGEGDAVLTEVADRFRSELRAFDLAYRIGGEEFLVLVPGVGIDEATELAERLRERISATPLADGHEMTMSFGVSASHRGDRFDYDAVFAVADAALYQAKRGGRDRVRSGRSSTVSSGQGNGRGPEQAQPPLRTSPPGPDQRRPSPPPSDGSTHRTGTARERSRRQG
jgi:diguanylate cyclase (GGDEF)-like protein